MDAAIRYYCVITYPPSILLTQHTTHCYNTTTYKYKYGE